MDIYVGLNVPINIVENFQHRPGFLAFSMNKEGILEKEDENTFLEIFQSVNSEWNKTTETRLHNSATND